MKSKFRLYKSKWIKLFIYSERKYYTVLAAVYLKQENWNRDEQKMKIEL